MIKDLWLTLPSKDIRKSRAFYTEIGFEFHPRQFGEDAMFGLSFGKKNFLVFLAPEEDFKTFASAGAPDLKNASEILFSIEVDSKSEVDIFAEKVVKAGGKIFSPIAESQGWMYGFGFIDLDGHRWNIMFMDWEKAKI